MKINLINFYKVAISTGLQMKESDSFSISLNADAVNTEYVTKQDFSMLRNELRFFAIATLLTFAGVFAKIYLS